MRRRTAPHVVILGGGFGGLYCARALRRAPVQITLVDRRNYHLFQPLLYEVATATLSPAEISAPLRYVLRRQRNVEVRMGEVVDVDVARRAVVLPDSEIAYDYLVVSTGLEHSYFGHDEWAARAPGLKSVADALEIKRRFLSAFEAAEWEADPVARQRRLTFVIVGAGPTGVELAGAMATVAHQVLPGDFRFVDTTRARVILVEGAGRVLPEFTERLSRKAKESLRRLGVEVRTGSLVTAIEPHAVVLENERIEAGTVVWAAGVRGSPLGARLGAAVDGMGRVRVQADCSVPAHRDVFVIGDLAHFEERGRVITGVAPAAIQMARFVARTIRDELRGLPRMDFRYFDKGSLATIGKAAAVARAGRLEISGFPAWITWVFIHVLYLIGFRNRVSVMAHWAWAWLASKRAARWIMGDFDLQVVQPRGAGEGIESSAPAPEATSSRRRTAPALPR
ncbi:MAG TPA: NAD(P)/FAD-dependent oxidoreductase [Longimicrobiales bacterium]|nr:NAD(P)/FAD-dependent oxidoreductase [Longimicrobiales bacterium]